MFYVTLDEGLGLLAVNGHGLFYYWRRIIKASPHAGVECTDARPVTGCIFHYRHQAFLNKTKYV